MQQHTQGCLFCCLKCANKWFSSRHQNMWHLKSDCFYVLQYLFSLNSWLCSRWIHDWCNTETYFNNKCRSMSMAAFSVAQSVCQQLFCQQRHYSISGTCWKVMHQPRSYKFNSKTTQKILFKCLKDLEFWEPEFLGGLYMQPTTFHPKFFFRVTAIIQC